MVKIPSFAKINVGLCIGALRPDGFHELRTVYQTIALHDIIRVEVRRGTGIAIHCDDPRVPKDGSNTCYRVVQSAVDALKVRGRVMIEIEKRLPVQGGLGGASGNAVAVLLALERAVRRKIAGPERLRIVAEVGSDLPLFLIGGTVLGLGHGEEVYPIPDWQGLPCVVALPEVSVSTPMAFAEWDKNAVKLTHSQPSDRMLEFSRMIGAWLSNQNDKCSGGRLSGVSASGGRAETPLLDLVQTGIENDFEQVVFPQYPELREIKRVLEKTGALYASLSGSGSVVYGLFRSRRNAQLAIAALKKRGTGAVLTSTLTRRQYWRKISDC